jgi:arylsulfatase A-like enzyme
MTLNVDFAPTILDMAGLEVPAEMQGESFAALLGGVAPESWRDAIYYHYYEYPKWHNVQPHYGIRTARYKLMHFYYDVDVWELYDLEEDPNELNNLYMDQEHEALIVSLKEKLKQLQVKYGDDISLEEMREVTRKGMVSY